MQIQHMLDSILNRLVAPQLIKSETVSLEPSITSITDSELLARRERAHLVDIIQLGALRNWLTSLGSCCRRPSQLRQRWFLPEDRRPTGIYSFQNRPRSPTFYNSASQVASFCSLDVLYILGTSLFRRPPRLTRIIHFPGTGAPRVFDLESTVLPTSRPPSRQLDLPDFEQAQRNPRRER